MRFHTLTSHKLHPLFYLSVCDVNPFYHANLIVHVSPDTLYTTLWYVYANRDLKNTPLYNNIGDSGIYCVTLTLKNFRIYNI